jgi:hypothetical protein
VFRLSQRLAIRQSFKPEQAWVSARHHFYGNDAAGARSGLVTDIAHEVQRHSGSAQWDDLTLVVAKARCGRSGQRVHKG